MSTHRGAYQSRPGRTAEALAAVRPFGGLNVYRCVYCHAQLARALDIVPHEAACRMKEPVEQIRAYAWRKFVRQWEAR